MGKLSPKLEYLQESGVLEHIRQACGAEHGEDESKDDLVERLPAFQLFDKYLEWEGILGYSSRLWQIVRDLMEMDEILAFEKEMQDADNGRA